jgi:hypothetical protein
VELFYEKTEDEKAFDTFPLSPLWPYLDENLSFDHQTKVL